MSDLETNFKSKNLNLQVNNNIINPFNIIFESKDTDTDLQVISNAINLTSNITFKPKDSDLQIDNNNINQSSNIILNNNFPKQRKIESGSNMLKISGNSIIL